MLSFETLDLIADSYTPLLLLGVLVTLLRHAIAKHWRHVSLLSVLFLSAIVITYGLMFLDKHFSLWALAQGDYSTHTAAATTLTGILCFAWPHIKIPFVALLLCYFALMLYQQYHSLFDIFSTALIVSLLLLGTVRLHSHFKRASSP